MDSHQQMELYMSQSNQIPKISRRHFILAAVLMMVTASHPITVFAKETIPMKLQPTQTIYVYRYQIDLPKEEIGNFGLGDSTYDAIDIESEPMTSIAYKEYIKNEIVKFENVDEYDKKDIIEMKHYADSVPNSYTLLKREKLFSSVIYKINSSTWNSGYIFKLKMGISDKYYQKAMDSLQNLLKNLRYRDNSKAVNEQGIYIDNGFILDDGSKVRYSSHGFSADFKNHPDLSISGSFGVGSAGRVKANGTLLARMNDKNSFYGKELTKTYAALGLKELPPLREGNRTVAGLVGEEIIEHIPNRDRGLESGTFEYSGEADSPFKPSIRIDLDSGNDYIDENSNQVRTDNSSITQKEFIKLFDNIISSIKLVPYSKP